MYPTSEVRTTSGRKQLEIPHDQQARNKQLEKLHSRKEGKEKPRS